MKAIYIRKRGGLNTREMLRLMYCIEMGYKIECMTKEEFESKYCNQNKNKNLIIIDEFLLTNKFL